MEALKAKTPAKVVVARSEALTRKILDTAALIAKVVGGTLGPGGRPVLIERPEYGILPTVTKDGVTVFKALGFRDPVSHSLLESARDCASRTATEAGDGPQPLWSKVLTPQGFVAMGNIATGMKICGTNGTIQTVLGVYEKGDREVYRIEFEQGQVVECCEDHLWAVTTNWGKQQVIPTKEMLKDYKKAKKNQNAYKYFIPLSAVEFARTEQEPSLDPYLVGVLLGDGSLCDTGSIELSMGLAKEAVLGKIHLPKGASMSTRWVPAKNSFRTKIKGIARLVDKIGLRNTDSYTKFIPRSYLTASVKDRQALLQGLLDTDGHVNSRGLFEFSTVNDQMAEDFLFLTRSLGKSVYYRLYHRKPGDGSYSKKPIHRFCELKGNRYGLKVTKIEPTGKTTPMRCIKVSNLDSLYITNDFVPTHNTTTTTILYEALLRLTSDYCKAHPSIAPQRVVASIQKTLKDVFRPEIDRVALKCDLSSEEGRRRLTAVAKTSANGDQELAEAVLKCYDICGDDGNVTIVDGNGRLPALQAERIDGFPIAKGYEHSCERFASAFINRQDLQQIQLEKPAFVLYFGRINDFQTIMPLMLSLQEMQQVGQLKTPNICIVATGFSEQVLGNLALNFPAPDSINIVPLLVPNDSPIPNAQRNFLDDLAAVVGGEVFDPVTHPLSDAMVEGGFTKLGNIGLDEEDKYETGGVRLLEIGRYRTTVHGIFDEDMVITRAEVVKAQLEAAGSELDAQITKVRLGALTGGIARLHVIGASNAEVKERRDRAEDAICAVRGALKDGCLPGGCWTLVRLAHCLSLDVPDDSIEDQILYPALVTPLHTLLDNVGATEAESKAVLDGMLAEIEVGDPAEAKVYDAAAGSFVNALDAGILDSLPAVRDALGNAVSIAVQHGTLGGVIVQPRDHQVEMTESRDAADFQRNSNLDENEADKRGF